MTQAIVTLELFDRNMDTASEHVYPETRSAAAHGLDWMLGGGGAAYISVRTAHEHSGHPQDARAFSFTRVGDEILSILAMDPPMRTVLYRMDGEEFVYAGV